MADGRLTPTLAVDRILAAFGSIYRSESQGSADKSPEALTRSEAASSISSRRIQRRNVVGSAPRKPRAPSQFAGQHRGQKGQGEP